jgi:TolB protein
MTSERVTGIKSESLTTFIGISNPAVDVQPAWSPDGTKIIFRSNRPNIDQLEFNLYSMNSDGGDIIQLTNTSDSELDAVWSPDSSKIIFTRFRSLITDSSPQLFLMDPDGTNWIQLTTTGAYRYPAWRPH